MAVHNYMFIILTKGESVELNNYNFIAFLVKRSMSLTRVFKNRCRHILVLLRSTVHTLLTYPTVL